MTAARLGFWAVLSAITVLSLLPLNFAVQSGLSDKVDHLAAYAALTATGRIGYRDRVPQGTLAVAVLVFGIGIELAQSFIPGRMMSSLDVVANTAGLLIGLGLSRLFLRRMAPDPAPPRGESNS